MSNNYSLATHYDFDKREFYLHTIEHIPNSNEGRLVETEIFTHDKLRDMTYDEFMLEYELFSSYNVTRQ